MLIEERTGRKLRYFTLPDTKGNPVNLNDWWQKNNLVIAFLDTPTHLLLDELVAAPDDLRENKTKLVLVTPHATLQAGILVLEDITGKAVQLQNLATPALMIVDRYGEVYTIWQDELPKAEEVLAWLTYIEIQCGSCTPY